MSTRLPMLLIACLLGAVPTVQSMHSASAAPAAKAKLLYQANWSAGLSASKWRVYTNKQGKSDFSVANGMLIYNGKQDEGAFAPFKTKGLKSFAVVVKEQVGTPKVPANSGVTPSYDIFVHRTYNSNQTGIFAGYEAVIGNPQDPEAANIADLVWTKAQTNFVPGGSFKPNSKFHTYRLEVAGTSYRLLIDKHQVIPWTVIQDEQGKTGLGLTFTYFPAKVKSFKVYSLSGSASTPIDASGLISRSLTDTDVSVPPAIGLFRDNTLYAADTQGLTVATLQNMGRVYGYLNVFGNSQTLITQSINQHTSPSGAKQIFDLFVQGVRDQSASAQDYTEIDTSTLGIGDESFAYSYQYDDQGQPSYVTDVLFHRGSYYESIYVDSYDKTVSATATTLAQTADKELQAKGSL